MNRDPVLQLFLLAIVGGWICYGAAFIGVKLREKHPRLALLLIIASFVAFGTGDYLLIAYTTRDASGRYDCYCK